LHAVDLACCQSSMLSDLHAVNPTCSQSWLTLSLTFELEAARIWESSATTTESNHSACCSIVTNHGGETYLKSPFCCRYIIFTKLSTVLKSVKQLLLLLRFLHRPQLVLSFPQPSQTVLSPSPKHEMHSQILASVLLFVSSTAALAIGITITIGAANNFGVCAGTTVTSTGNTVVVGSVGVAPGTAITGFPPGVATSLDSADPAAVKCEADVGTAYNACQGATNPTVLTGQDLAGKTLYPGVYKYATTAGLAANGVLTFDALFLPTAQFIVQVGTELDLFAGSKMLLKHGASACNVFFCAGSSVVIGANASINATILAYTSISAADAVTDKGGLFAINGAVTLINDKITKCA